MLLFGLFEGERVPFDIPLRSSVSDLKRMIRTKFNIDSEVTKWEKKVLVLSFAGSSLQDSWIIPDLGIVHGSTIRIHLRDEINPLLYIVCLHNQETLSIVEEVRIDQYTVEELRSRVSQKTGIPVGVFRLVSKSGKEMYDSHFVDDYSLEVGDKVTMETWDGYNELINLSVMGFTPNVMSELSSVEIISRFQMRVAMYIAAHFGHVHLAGSLLKQGVSPSTPIGEHPSRQWCREVSHVDTYKAPIHEAAYTGHLSVIRLFVNSEITCLLTKDGNGLAPLNISLRTGNRNCSSFLLAKQWGRVYVTKYESLSLIIYNKVKHWCDRAKERCFIVKGPTKSTLKRRTLYTGPLVTFGVLVDGYSSSQMTGKPKALMKERETKKRPVSSRADDVIEDPEVYFKQLTALQNFHAMKIRRANGGKWGKMMDKAALSVSLLHLLKETEDTEMDQTDDTTFCTSPRLVATIKNDDFKLPTIKEKIISTTTSRSPRARHRKKKSAKTEKDEDAATSIMNKTSDESTSVAKKDKMFAILMKIEKSRKRKLDKEKKLASALLVSKSIDNTVPLPAISNEQNRRPFFYYSGDREDQLIASTLMPYDRHRGSKARDTAIQSLAIATTFKHKPWLGQVRMAMNLTSQAVRRDMALLQSAQSRRRYVTA